jgi:PilZ domain
MSDAMADRREAPRYALILAAEVTDLATSAVLNARSSDVSRSGCYIDTLNPVPVGSEVRVRLQNGEVVFEMTARVVYICPGLGMGLHWGSNAPPDKLAILDSWLLDAAKNAS